MKFFALLPLIMFTLWQSALAQKDEGIILFEERINMHRNLPPDDVQIRTMIPEFRVTKSELLFNASESLYRNVEEEEDDEEMGNGQMMIRIQRPETIIYRNVETGRKAEFREFMGKQYLVLDSLNKQNWKITTETKDILGYSCLKATMVDTAMHRNIVAWFTDALPLSSGPAAYFQLPGMILEVDINTGESGFIAKKVDFKKLKKNELTAPTKGEKISDAEYRKKVEDAMRQSGGPGIRIIRN